MKKETTISFEDFKREAACAAIDHDQALAMAWLARIWFGGKAYVAFMKYWDAENK